MRREETQSVVYPHPISFYLSVLGAPSERSLGQGTELRYSARGLCPIPGLGVVGIPYMWPYLHQSHLMSHPRRF